MKIPRLALLVSLFLSLSLNAYAAGGAADSSSRAASSSTASAAGSMDWSRVSSYLDETVSDGMLKGYSFSIFDPSGVLFEQAGGNQNLRSVELLASASKLPAAAAIMTLVDAGKLDLDTPVGAYLGNHIQWPLDKHAITLRMLLSHTAGFPGSDEVGAQPVCLDNPLTTLQYCAQQIADEPLATPPGSTFNYTGVDYQLAGYIAVLVSGSSSWQDFFDTAIARPLGMTSFTYEPQGTANPLIAGGASSNLADYTTFLRMILNDGRAGPRQILSSSAVAQLERNELGLLSNVNVAYSPLPPVQYPGYGMGLFLSAPDLYPGSPGPEFSDPGLFGSVPWFDLGLQYGAVLLIVDTDTTGVDVWNGVRPLIINQLGSGLR